MSKLESYPDIDSKSICFDQEPPDAQYSRIDTAYQFKQWYEAMTARLAADKPYANFFRGANEAKFKLYNSAQRYWIQNKLMEAESLAMPLSYLDMIQNMVDKAKEVKLLRQVFEYYEITEDQMDFPLLSILQHYNAPTPLMDWTYDFRIALYFATCDLRRSERAGVIEDYISVYRLQKDTHKEFLKDNLQYISGNVFPQVKHLGNWLASGTVIYISDFEVSEFENGGLDKRNRKIKPLTTYYNLNILAQKGLFVFNPHETRPLEDLPSPTTAKIHCYNISKDLSELIKYTIGRDGINTEFLFPDLRRYAGRILEDYLKFVMA